MATIEGQDIQAIQKRIYVGLFSTQGLFTAATIVAFTLTPVIAVALSGSESAAGLPSTLTLVGRAALAYPIGWLMDHIGRRFGLSLGYFLGILGAVISFWGVVTGSFIAFLAGAFTLGAMRAAAEQGRFVAAEVYPAGQRANIIGTVVFAGTIGAVGAPLLVSPAGAWATSIGLPEYAGPFLLAGLFLLVALFVALLTLRPDPLQLGRTIAAQEPDAAENALIPARPLATIFASSAVRLAVLAMLIGQLVMTLLMVITPVHMNHQGQTTQAISWVIMAHTLGMFGLSSVTGRIVHRFGRRPMIAAGAIVLVAACVLAPVANSVPMLALALFLLGLGWNFCYVAGSALLSDSVGVNERGRTQGVSEVVVALASGTGSLSTGAIFAGGGLLAVGALGLALVLFLVATLVIVSRPGPATIAGGTD